MNSEKMNFYLFEQNNKPLPECEGYSPYEMHKFFYNTYDPDSIVQIQALPDADYQRIPMLNQIKYLAHLIDKSEELKLTQKGFLPTKIVSELYQQRYLIDEDIELGITKLYKETDSMTIHLTHMLIKMAGLAKKRYGKLSLTNKAPKILADNHALLRLIFVTMATRFNWGYFDGFEDEEIGQASHAFTLFLLSKYGHKKRQDTFYVKKYFKANPSLLPGVEPYYESIIRRLSLCYSIRTFDRFLDYFGLITIQRSSDDYFADKFITKTDLLDKMFTIKPHTIYA